VKVLSIKFGTQPFTAQDVLRLVPAEDYPDVLRYRVAHRRSPARVMGRHLGALAGISLILSDNHGNLYRLDGAL